MKLPPWFAQQFRADDDTPLAGGLLYAFEAGTTTPLATYTDQAGLTASAHPIELDARGMAVYWLSETAEYTFVLREPWISTGVPGAIVDTWDDVGGSTTGSAGVVSVNGETGTVTLTADDIGYTTSATAAWFTASDTAASLDQIIDKVDEIAAPVGFTAVIVGGDITTSVGTGYQSYGNRSVSVTGGTAPYTHRWIVQPDGVSSSASGYISATGAGIYPSGDSRSSTIALAGLASASSMTATVTDIVTDATGRVTTASFTVSATHA